MNLGRSTTLRLTSRLPALLLTLPAGSLARAGSAQRPRPDRTVIPLRRSLR